MDAPIGAVRRLESGEDDSCGGSSPSASANGTLTEWYCPRLESGGRVKRCGFKSYRFRHYIGAAMHDDPLLASEGTGIGSELRRLEP